MKILFTIWSFPGIHGSAMHILEIAKYLKNHGGHVDVVCVRIESGWLYKATEHQINVFTPFNFFPIDTNYDIVWACHFPVLYYLINNGLSYQKLINNSLSPYEPLEAPAFFYDQIDLNLVNSQETQKTLSEKYNIPEQSLTVFPNSVPSEFFAYFPREEKSPMLSKLAIVSNHVPNELRIAVEFLKKKSIICDIYGLYDCNMMVTPELLSKYDAIVTIGKTVQYAMAQGIPVFCYDRFGGPGYIIEENLVAAEYYNFSGRCCRTQYTAGYLADKLIDDFSVSCNNTEYLKKYAWEYFNLEKNIETVLHKLKRLNRSNHVCGYPILITKVYVDAYVNGLIRMSVSLGYELGESIASAKTWQKERDSLFAEHDRLIVERDALFASRSWRFTKPIRKLGFYLRQNRLLYRMIKCLLFAKRHGIMKTLLKIVAVVSDGEKNNRKFHGA